MRFQKSDSFKEYLTHPNIGSSDLANIFISPAHFEAGRKYTKPSPSLLKGSLTHALALEDDSILNERYIWLTKEEMPYPNSSMNNHENKEYKEHLISKADREGKEVVETKLLNEATQMAEVIKKNKEAKELIENCICEQSFYIPTNVEGREFPTKLRPDGINPGNYYISIKTTRASTIQSFYRSAYDLAYHLKEAYYHFVLSKIFDQNIKGDMIVVTNSKPYICYVFDMSLNYSYYENGEAFMFNAIYKYLDYMENKDKYQGRGADIYEESLPMHIPLYKEGEVEEIEQMNDFLKSRL